MQEVTSIVALFLDLFESYNVHMLRCSLYPMYRNFSSKLTATPCITFFVCISELKDSLHNICDAVFKEYSKIVGKWIDKVCEKLYVRLKCKNLLKNWVLNHVVNFGIKSFLKDVLKFGWKSWVGKMCKRKGWKKWEKKIVWEKWFARVGWKIRWTKLAGKLCQKMLWNNRIDNCVQHLDDQFR